MRSVIFRYGDIAELADALSETSGSLPLPEGESVGDGEWVLAIFEIGSRRRATASAARGVRAAGDTHLEFERRDWERLSSFASARSEHMRSARPVATSSSRMPAAAPATAPPLAQTGESAALSDAPPRSRRFDDLPPQSALESTRIPFGARVLVVDDHGGAGDELRAMLAEIGLVAELASDADRAEERMRAQTFDAIVVELNAPRMDSRAFVTRIRSDARIADIPVLILSSRPTSRDAVDAFASGGDDFLSKPFRATELAARIFSLLRRARLARAQLGGSGAAR